MITLLVWVLISVGIFVVLPVIGQAIGRWINKNHKHKGDE